MEKKTLITLLIIFLILTVVSIFTFWNPFSNSNPKIGGPNLTIFTEDSTDKVVIRKGEEKTLSREKDGWKINGFKASKTEITSLFDGLKSFSINSLVSKNPENHKAYDITDESGMTLSLYQNNATTSFIIGRMGNVFETFYIREDKSDNVYLATSPVINKLYQEINTWRDKIIVDIPKDSINKIEYTVNYETQKIEKNNSIWKAEKYGVANDIKDDKIAPILAVFNPLEASGFLTAEEQKQFGWYNKSIIKVTSGGKTTEIDALEKNGEYWANVKGNDIYFKIPSVKINTVLKLKAE